MALTSALGQFIADLSPNRIPDEAVRIAHMGIIDCIGTMIVGRTEPCTQILKDVLARHTVRRHFTSVVNRARDRRLGGSMDVAHPVPWTQVCLTRRA